MLQTDITELYEVPSDVKVIFNNACYDCHSNNTRYPWYSFIQPGAWFMNNHILSGKKELNFSDFGSYSARRRQSKLKAINDAIKDRTMPLWSYSFMHRDARLSKVQILVLTTWITKTIDSLSVP